jgi:hypothetical protein
VHSNGIVTSAEWKWDGITINDPVNIASEITVSTTSGTSTLKGGDDHIYVLNIASNTVVTGVDTLNVGAITVSSSGVLAGYTQLNIESIVGANVSPSFNAMVNSNLSTTSYVLVGTTEFQFLGQISNYPSTSEVTITCIESCHISGKFANVLLIDGGDIYVGGLGITTSVSQPLTSVIITANLFYLFNGADGLYGPSSDVVDEQCTFAIRTQAALRPVLITSDGDTVLAASICSDKRIELNGDLIELKGARLSLRTCVTGDCAIDVSAQLSIESV